MLLGHDDRITLDSKWTLSLCAHHARHATHSFLDAFRPSIFTKTPRKELTATSWLDGLRGFAALLVYWQHHQGWAHVGTHTNETLENSFGYKDQYYFACFPGIRLFFTGGHIAVCVFFIISGYVLSAKPLALIHAGEILKLEDNLASAMFRRWPRLFLPAIFTTFVYATSWHLFNIWTAVPAHQDSYFEELKWWIIDMKNFIWVFRDGDTLYTKYNYHLWSIVVEFRGSMIVFTSLFAFSRCSRNSRLLSQLVLISYFLFIAEGMMYAMFSTGVLMGDLELLAKTDNLPSCFNKYLKPYKRVIFHALFLIGVYLSGVPSIDFHTNISLLQESPGWRWLAWLKPDSVSRTDYKWFYLFWAAIFIVSSISHIAWLKAFFEKRFNQYLGRISFALYLVHGPILWMFADRLYLAAGLTREVNVDGVRSWLGIWRLPTSGPLGLEPAFLIPHLVILPLTLYVAEVCTTLFDRPSIKFAQWSYWMVLAQDIAK